MKKILSKFDTMFKNPTCELHYKTPFQLLVAVILSAQCTDKRVNLVTDELFKTHNKPEDFVLIPLDELEEKIHSCGFYRNKAKAIKSTSLDIVERFDGKVPSNFDDLTSLAGVGRKTANVIIAEAFKGDALAVDTHVLRVSNRLGLVDTKDPNKCEDKLKKIFPKKSWSKLHYQMVLFGRYHCKAIKPQCKECLFADICKWTKTNNKKK
ncbi:MAG: endonuclease III [Clostridia bacterium]|nr:endonuclease III [Clostridia bacterium]